MLEAGLLTLVLTSISYLFVNGLDCSVSFGMLILGNAVIVLLAKCLPRWFSEEETFWKWTLWYGFILICSLLFYKWLGSGCRMLLNGVIEGVNQYYGTGIRSLPLSRQSDIYLTLFMLGVGSLFLPLVVWNDTRRHSWWFLVELAAIAVVSGLLVGRAPDTKGLFCGLLGVVLYRLLVVEQEQGGINNYGKLIMITAGIIVLGMSLLAAVMSENAIQSHHNAVLSFQKRLEQRLGFSGFSGYTDGKLSNQTPQKTHKTMLSVTMDSNTREKLFFRGFVGEEYKTGEWSPLSTNDFYKSMGKAKQTSEEISLDVLERPFRLMEKITTSGERECNIHYVGVQDNYAYAPYFANYELGQNHLTEFGDGGFTRNTDAKSTFCMMDSESANWILTFLEENPGKWEEEADKEYEQYVEQHYLQVPEQLKEELTQFMGTDSAPNLYEAVELVRDKLQSQCTYSLTLDNLSMGEDYVEHFLFQEKEGFCCHFATTATLLFRSLGIPARYATGYCATPEDFKKNENNMWQADITDDSAHAWTEIYSSSLGWIPVEVTPGYGYDSLLEEALWQEEPEGEEETEETEPEQETENTQEQQAENTTEAAANTTASAPAQNTQMANEPGTEAMSRRTTTGAKKMWKVLFWLGLLAVLLFAGVYAKRSYEKYQWSRRHEKEWSRAVEAVRRQTLHHLRFVNCPKEEGESEQEYFLRRIEMYTKKKYQAELSKEQLEYGEKFYQILEKAAYSGQLLEEGDAMCANQFYDSVFKNPV